MTNGELGPYPTDAAVRAHLGLQAGNPHGADAGVRIRRYERRDLATELVRYRAAA
jgi:hypothetical protein